MNEISKTTRELRRMGVTVTLLGLVTDFQKDNQLDRLEMLQLLNDCQLFIFDNIIHDMKEDAK